MIGTAPNLTHIIVFLEVIYKVYHKTDNNQSDLLIGTTLILTQMVVCLEGNLSSLTYDTNITNNNGSDLLKLNL